jgi:hypothetical protein
MKIIIEDGIYVYQADWDRSPKAEGGFLEEYRPEVSECIEAFLRLLENTHSRDRIVLCLKEGIGYSGML